MSYQAPLSGIPFSDSNYWTAWLRGLATVVITALDEDSSPTLAGNLDTNGYSIANSGGTLNLADDTSITGYVEPTSYRMDGITLSTTKWIDVTVNASDLDGSGTKTVIAGGSGDQFMVRQIFLHGGGTSYGAGGNRTIGLTDGTTTWTTIPNANIESAPATTVTWGNAVVPFLTGTSKTASTAGSTIRFQYNGGTTDHSTGSIQFSVLLEKVA